MDPVVSLAVLASIAILVVVGVVRVLGRGRPHQDAFDGSGRRVVPVGEPGVVRTPLAPTGVVYAAGEEWTARAVDGAALAPGIDVRVVAQDGLTLIVAPGPPGDPITD